MIEKDALKIIMNCDLFDMAEFRRSGHYEDCPPSYLFRNYLFFQFTLHFILTFFLISTNYLQPASR